MKYNVGTMKYFLVGYMACGKTRRGKVIAEEQGVRFIDLDAYIVERENRSISEIFAAIGEAGFRRLETFYLKEVNYIRILSSRQGEEPPVSMIIWRI